VEDGNLYLRLRKMSNTIYAVNGKVSRSFVYKAKEGRYVTRFSRVSACYITPTQEIVSYIPW
jgi:hypothetical protein